MLIKKFNNKRKNVKKMFIVFTSFEFYGLDNMFLWPED